MANKLGLKICKEGGTINVVNSNPTPIDGIAHKVDVSEHRGVAWPGEPDSSKHG